MNYRNSTLPITMYKDTPRQVDKLIVLQKHQEVNILRQKGVFLIPKIRKGGHYGTS